MTVHFFKIDPCFLLPTVAVGNAKRYYGYNVLNVNVVWLKWQLVFRLGVKKVKKHDY